MQIDIQLKEPLRRRGVAYTRVERHLQPLTSFLASGVAYLKHKGGRLFSRDQVGPNVASRMDWRGFELLIVQVFRARGFKVMDVCSGQPGEGIDVVLLRGSEKFLVQCKYWNTRVVDKAQVGELNDMVIRRGATGGYIVTLGSYTPEAVACARDQNITLVDGARLEAMLQKVRYDSVTPDARRG
jgi:restriction system protein